LDSLSWKIHDSIKSKLGGITDLNEPLENVAKQHNISPEELNSLLQQSRKIALSKLASSMKMSEPNTAPDKVRELYKQAQDAGITTKSAPELPGK
jgi:hypothetical protein